MKRAQAVAPAVSRFHGSVRRGAWCVTVLGLALAASPLAAQSPTMTVVGTIADSAGTRLRRAQVLVVGTTRTVLASEQGDFVLEGLPRAATVLRVRRLGHAPRSIFIDAPADTVRVNVVMDPLPQELAPVIVEEEELYVRKLTGLAERMRTLPRSSFMLRADIERTTMPRTSELLRRMSTLRCPDAAIYVDGVHSPDFDIDALHPSQLDAIEFLRGAAAIPPEFNATRRKGSRSYCVVLLWTR